MTRRDGDLLAGVNAGDRVWYRPSSAGEPREAEVIHATAKYLHVGSRRFRRSDGREVGGGSYASIKILTDQPERLANARRFDELVEECRDLAAGLARSAGIRIPGKILRSGTLLDGDRVREVEAVRDRLECLTRLLERVADLTDAEIDALAIGGES